MRPTYKKAILVLAENISVKKPDDLLLEEGVHIVARIWEKSARVVAADILKSKLKVIATEVSGGREG